MNIQLAEDQEDIRLDSESLNVEKSCETCQTFKYKDCKILQKMFEYKWGIECKLISEKDLFCSLHKMKEVD